MERLGVFRFRHFGGRKVWEQMHRHYTIAATAILTAAASVASAATAKKIIIEGETLDGLALPTVIRVVTNPAGGYAVLTRTSDNVDRLFGTAAPTGTPATLLTETDLGAAAISSFFGLDNAGVFSTHAGNGSAHYSGTTSNAATGGAIPGSPLFFGNTLASFASGSDTLFVANTRTTSGGANSGSAILAGLSPTIVLKSGDATGDGPISSISNAFSFQTKASANGTVITTARVGATNTETLLIGGSAVTTGGTVIKSGASAANAGAAGRNFSLFTNFDLNDAGDYALAGRFDGDSTSDGYVLVNGSVVLQEGQSIGGGLSITGNPTSVVVNEQGDYVAAWAVSDGVSSFDALFVNGELFYKAGDAVDLDGNGTADTTFASFQFSLPIDIGPADSLGRFNIFFTGRAASTGTNDGAFVIAVPEPSMAILPMAGALALLRRRR